MPLSQHLSVIVERYILLIRGEKVILDTELARLYNVETKALIQAVKRNPDRFPKDFMFQLSETEFEKLRSQHVILGRGGRRYAPYAFTEQGVAMLSSVLNSKRAISVNVEIMRAFVRLRALLEGNQKLRQKLEELEQKYDEQFKVIFDAIRQMMAPDKPAQKHRIGFIP